MKLVHEPVIIGDSKNTGAASTTFPWGSKRTRNSESSNTRPAINSRPTPKTTGPPAELCWVTAADNMGRDDYPKYHKQSGKKHLFFFILEKAEWTLISLTLLTLTILLLLLLRTLCSNTSTPSGFQLA